MAWKNVLSVLGLWNGSTGIPVSTTNPLPCDVIKQIGHDELVAEGRFSGRYFVNKAGVNPSVSSGGVPEDIWFGGGIYSGFPTGAAETLSVSSSSVNDTSAGTGARTINIRGLNSSFNQINELITLNGTTIVNTVNSFLRVDGAGVQTAGSGGVNAGDISIHHTTTTANVFAIIPANVGRAQLSNYTVPSGNTGYLTKLKVTVLSSGSTHMKGYIWRRAFGKAGVLAHPFSLSDTKDHEIYFRGGIPFSEKEDFVVRIVDCSGGGNEVLATWDMLVVENS